MLHFISTQFHKAVARLALVVALFSAHCVLYASEKNGLEDELFEEYEIRVIRPRYFIKSSRLELGGQMAVVMNQTFIYTYLMTGILTYHFNELFAFEGSGAFGFSLDKEDKRILDSEFDINTQIIREKYNLTGGLVWTPIYGKYQLSSGRLIYFDTFVSGGFGTFGVEHRFDHCQDINSTAITDIPSNKTVSYPGFYVGIGQRFFLDKHISVRWDVRDKIFNYSTKDTACDPNTTDAETKSHQNVTMQLGASYFL